MSSINNIPPMNGNKDVPGNDAYALNGGRNARNTKKKSLNWHNWPVGVGLALIAAALFLRDCNGNNCPERDDDCNDCRGKKGEWCAPTVNIDNRGGIINNGDNNNNNASYRNNRSVVNGDNNKVNQNNSSAQRSRDGNRPPRRAPQPDNTPDVPACDTVFVPVFDTVIKLCPPISPDLVPPYGNKPPVAPISEPLIVEPRKARIVIEERQKTITDKCGNLLYDSGVVRHICESRVH